MRNMAIDMFRTTHEMLQGNLYQQFVVHDQTGDAAKFYTTPANLSGALWRMQRDNQDGNRIADLARQSDLASVESAARTVDSKTDSGLTLSWLGGSSKCVFWEFQCRNICQASIEVMQSLAALYTSNRPRQTHLLRLRLKRRSTSTSFRISPTTRIWPVQRTVGSIRPEEIGDHAGQRSGMAPLLSPRSESPERCSGNLCSKENAARKTANIS
jgi:hypothetical protein